MPKFAFHFENDETLMSTFIIQESEERAPQRPLKYHRKIKHLIYHVPPNWLVSTQGRTSRYCLRFPVGQMLQVCEGKRPDLSPSQTKWEARRQQEVAGLSKQSHLSLLVTFLLAVGKQIQTLSSLSLGRVSPGKTGTKSRTQKVCH